MVGSSEEGTGVDQGEFLSIRNFANKREEKEEKMLVLVVNHKTRPNVLTPPVVR